jgi:hypothetical protein
MRKQDWIDEVTGSARRITPVRFTRDIVDAVELKLQGAITTAKAIPLRWVYSTAAVLIVLVVLNVRVWIQGNRHDEGNGIQQMIQEYGWNSGNDIYTTSTPNLNHE